MGTGVPGLSKVLLKVAFFGTVIQTQPGPLTLNISFLSPPTLFLKKNLPPKVSEVLLSFLLNTKNSSGNTLHVLGSHYEDQYFKKNDSDIISGKICCY